MLQNVLFSLNGLVMIAAPLLFATVIARRYGTDWGLFGAGALTFIGSQLFHLPFNWGIEQASILPTDLSAVPALVLVALFYGLSAGLFEEIARFVTYRYWMKDARTWETGLMLGAGHGGVESIVVGLLFVVNLLFLAGLQAGYFTSVLPESALQPVLEQAAAFFQTPWYEVMLGAVERLFALVVHMSLSLMVLQCFTRNNLLWLVAAIGWHAALNAVALVGVNQWGIYAAEGLIGVFAFLSLFLIHTLRNGEGPQSGPALEVGAVSVECVEEEVSREQLDESRYE